MALLVTPYSLLDAPITRVDYRIISCCFISLASRRLKPVSPSQFAIDAFLCPIRAPGPIVDALDWHSCC